MYRLTYGAFFARQFQINLQTNYGTTSQIINRSFCKLLFLVSQNCINVRLRAHLALINVHIKTEWPHQKKFCQVYPVRIKFDFIKTYILTHTC